jgi:hypothetical protein
MATDSEDTEESEEQSAKAKVEANVAKHGGTIAAPAPDTKDEPAGNYTQKVTTATYGQDDPEQQQPEWEQLANAQAAQYLAGTQQLAPLTSGTGISNIDAQMASGAESMLGQSGGGAMAAWLNQQGAAAAVQYAPVQSAVNQEETAEQSAEKLEAGGLQQMGTAETAQIQEAPYQQLLQSLAADVPYKLLGNYGNFNLAGITGQNIPSGIGLALQNLNVDTAGTTTNAPQLPSPTTAGGGTSSTALTTPDTSGAPQT